MQRVGAYEVLYELRSGGMGSVLLARRRGPGSFEKLVAIKTIRAELAAAQQVRAMFLDEAAILARLGHPAVATVHDFGEEAKNLYLVMEYVAGVSLNAVIELRPPPHIAARLIAEACRGIHAAHELRDHSGALLGVVHRDISPDNVLLGFDGRVKVIDFGIALIKGRQAPVTELGMLKGKPPYMSPEQIKNEAIDRRSDVFALGAVLWELLVGEPLFQGESIYAIARAIEHQAIDPPSRHAGGLPPGLDAIVLEALHRDPQQRLATAARMATRLEEVVAAAGGESLEAWSQRTLAPQREAHRRWLGQILGGGAAPAMGRATGAVTAMAMLAPTAAVQFAPAQAPAGSSGEPGSTGPSEAPAGSSSEPGPVALAEAAPPVAPLVYQSLGQSLGREVGERPGSAPSGPGLREPDGTHRGTHRGTQPGTQHGRPGRFALVLGLALLGAALLSWRLIGRAPPAAEVEHGADAAPIAIAERLDAAERPDAGIPVGSGFAADGGPDGIDDGEPDRELDARPREASARLDARVRDRDPPRRDARTRHPSPDARPTEPPRPVAPDATPGEPLPPGHLRVLAEPFAYVTIDGQSFGATPILSLQLSAGRHTVVLTDPVSGQVRLRKTVDVPSRGMARVESP